jgi:hypothetical protein
VFAPEGSHPADEDRHLGCGQGKQVGAVEEQRLGRELLASLQVVSEPVG